MPPTLYSPPDRTRTASRFAFVVPLAFVTYSLAFLDRNNYGYASAGGMAKTLKLTDNQAELLPALFFIGYFLFQIPSASYAARRSVRWLVFWALILWGILSALTGVIRNVHLLMADRVLLGAVEGVVLPAMLVFLTRWFTRKERSRANSLLMLGNPLTMTWASAASGYIIQYYDYHPLKHLQGWQMMFIVEGMPSVLWAFVWLWLAKDHPADAPWLDADEAAAVQSRLDDEQRDIPAVRNYWAAFADARVVMLSLMFFCFSSAAYAFMFWMPQIVKSHTGSTIGITGLLMAIPYLLACLSIFGVSWISDMTLRRKPFVWGSMFVGATAYLLAWYAGPQHFTLAFAALVVVGSCIYTSTSPQWAWMAEMLPRNVLGESMALVNSIGALGGFTGVYLGGMLKTTGGSAAMLLFGAGCFVAAGILALAIGNARPKARGFEVMVVKG